MEVPAHLTPVPPLERAITKLVVAAAAASGVVYLGWRLSTTMAGADPFLAGALLFVDLVVAARFVVVAVPGLRLDVHPIPPPDNLRSPTDASCDLILMAQAASTRELRSAILAARRVSGRHGLIVVGDDDRPEVSEVCRAMGVRHVRTGSVPGLGTEPHRHAPYLALVPATQLASPHLVAVAAAVLDNDPEAGAVSGAVTVHATVALVGSRGYDVAADADERLAARLDGVGAAPPGAGPIVFRREALAGVGGVPWDSVDPALAAHRCLQQVGWRTRFATTSIAHRMAPATEVEALARRARRLEAWGDALRRRDSRCAGGSPARWARVPELLQRLEATSVPARLVAILLPAAIALTGRVPVQISSTYQAAAVAGTWLALSGLATVRLRGRPSRPFEAVRIGMRVLGGDLRVVGGRAAPSGATLLRWTALALALVLGSATACLWAAAGKGPELDAPTRLALALLAFGSTAIVRDAAAAYRQKRRVPRLALGPPWQAPVLELSPEGWVVPGTYLIGSCHETAVTLRRGDGRRRTFHLSGTVRARRVHDGLAVCFIEADDDPGRFDELSYYCAVVGPSLPPAARVCEPSQAPRPG